MKIEYINKMSDISSLREEWNRIAQHNMDDRFYLTYDWHKSLLELCSIQPNELHIFIIKKDSKTVGIIPCVLSKKKKRLFDLNTLQLAGNIYSFERGAVVINEFSESSAKAFADFLCNEFKNSWDMIEFSSISPFDIFHDSFSRAIKQQGLTSYIKNQFTNVITDISIYKSSDEFNNSLSKNVRRKITKSINKMNRGGSFSIKLFNGTNDELEPFIDDYYQVYYKSWKKSEKDPLFHRRMAEYFNPKGKLRLLILYYSTDTSTFDEHVAIKSIKDDIGDSNKNIEGCVPIAAYYAIQHGNTTFGLKTVYDMDYSNFSAGSVIVYYFIKYLIDVEKSSLLNHQIGTQEFKYQMSGKDNAVFINHYAANNKSLLAKIEFFIDLYVIPVYKKALSWVNKAS